MLQRTVLTCDWETAETPLLLESLCLTESGVTGNDNRVEDEAVLITLHLANHVGLSIRGAVVVNDTETTLESHVNSHLVLSDSVHGRGHKRRLDGNALGDGGVKDHLRGREANVARQQQEVIVGQTTVLGRVHELMEIKAIVGLVLLEHLQGSGVVKRTSESVDGRHLG